MDEAERLFRDLISERNRARRRREYSEPGSVRAAAGRKYRQRHQAKIAAYKKNWAQNNRDKRRNAYLRRRYGITLVEKQNLIHAQKNKCAICDRVFRKGSIPHTDHCHRTGRVRGVLCKMCNHLLGNAKDSSKLLQRAIAYLRAARGKK